MTGIPGLRDYDGPVFLSYGFRPFFLFGAIYGGLGILAWLPMFNGELELGTAFSPVDWHVHEMLYGYLPAVVTGFLLTSEQFQRLMADNGVVCSMSRSGNVWDNAAMESFFSSLKTERTARKMYRTRDEAKADVFDYIERFYNPKRRHSTIGYMSPMEFERQAGLA
jgi:putative transposase